MSEPTPTRAKAEALLAVPLTKPGSMALDRPCPYPELGSSARIACISDLELPRNYQSLRAGSKHMGDMGYSCYYSIYNIFSSARLMEIMIHMSDICQPHASFEGLHLFYGLLSSRLRFLSSFFLFLFPLFHLRRDLRILLEWVNHDYFLAVHHD